MQSHTSVGTPIRTSLGTIRSLEPSKYNATCTYVLVSVNKTFYLEYLQFFVNDENQLINSDTGKTFAVGDEVKVMSCKIRNKTYPKLLSLTSTMIDYCPVCRHGLEPTDAQRIDCDGCSSHSEKYQKNWINECMTLVSLDAYNYTYSTGYKMVFVSNVDNECYTFVVFPRDRLIYPKANTFKVGSRYTVCGWTDTRRSLEVVDINDII